MAVSAPPNRRPRRAAFTLIELLVVIAILGVLISMLLPAMSAARESSRRAQCLGNLHQLALGLLAYHDQQRSFPASGEWPDSIPRISMHESTEVGPNWAIRILPELEQQSLYGKFDLTTPISRPVNRDARGAALSVMRCPSDYFVDAPFEGPASAGDAAAMGDNWARGNYAANSGNAPLAGNGQTVPPVDGPTSPGWGDVKRRGALGPNVTVNIRDIEDGSSHTILLAEVRAGVNRRDRRGVWALSGAGSSALYWFAWSEGSVGPANGPNDRSESSDDIPGCLDIVLEAGGAGGVGLLASEGMTCRFNRGLTGGQAGARSAHPGGVGVAAADGSVHFVADSIETSERCCSPWDRLVLARDGEMAPEF